MLRFQVVPFAISPTFGFNLSMKVYARENPYKNGVFLVGFKRKKKTKKTVKSDERSINRR